MQRLANEEARDQRGSHQDGDSSNRVEAVGNQSSVKDVVTEDLEAQGNDGIPQHEALDSVLATDEIEKSDRTVFLGNVSVEAIKSKTARKILLNHLSSCLSELPSSVVPHKVESLRFRSTAFASGVGPKRAAYAKKELMEETTHSTNAYVIYTTPAAARKAAKSLNGTAVLDRHLRTDLVANPAEIDHTRCVFVGNLGFVDEEMIETETENGDKDRKRKAKDPADAEEGLWRTFGRAGKVESVRVIRDRSTRVGKGIAYVQFHHENSVESALLYHDKKFPPLLPRKLRVTRARKPKKVSKVAPQDQGRDMNSHIPGETKKFKRVPKGARSATTTKGDRSGSSKRDGGFVFEGHRATQAAARIARGGQKKRKHTIKPTTRSSRRGAAFKAAGGKRQ
jgi:nucleolar protein 12